MPPEIGDYVLQACLDRLRAASNVSVLAGKDMNRKGASDLAKSSTETYVLLLELSIDSAYDGPGMADFRNCIVAYTLYEPKTAKVKASGRIYFDANYYGNRGGPLGRVGTGKYTPEDAGHKTAEEVLGALDSTMHGSIPVPR
jgi:hypothetical protein